MADQNLKHAINLIEYGLLRIGVATPEMKVADVAYNQAEIVKIMRQAHGQGVSLVLFPELCLTGYTCADLFFQQLLQQQVETALVELAELTSSMPISVVVGAPISVDGRLFNCAVFLSDGQICGLVPKTYLPNSGEFYEQRWFCSAVEATSDIFQLGSSQVPFGPDLLFRAKDRPEVLIG